MTKNLLPDPDGHDSGGSEPDGFEPDGLDAEAAELARLMRSEFGQVQPSEVLLARIAAASRGDGDSAGDSGVRVVLVDAAGPSKRNRWNRLLPVAAAVLVGAVVTGALIIGRGSQDTQGGPIPPDQGAKPSTAAVVSTKSAVVTTASGENGTSGLVSGTGADGIPLPTADWLDGSEKAWTVALPRGSDDVLGLGTMSVAGSCVTMALSGISGYTAWPAGYSLVQTETSWRIIDSTGSPVLGPVGTLFSGFVGGAVQTIPADSTDPCLPPGEKMFFVDPELWLIKLIVTLVALPNSDWTAGQEAMGALLDGVDLLWDGRCLTAVSDGDIVSLLWPAGYSANAVGGWLQIIDENGRVVLASHEKVDLAGGFVTVSKASDNDCTPAGSEAFSIQQTFDGLSVEASEGSIVGGSTPPTMPAETSALPPVILPLPSSGWKLGDPAMEALLSGQLVWDGTCLTVSRGGLTTSVAWPVGYTLQVADGVARIVDAEGVSVVQAGELVMYGGGGGLYQGQESACWRQGDDLFQIQADLHVRVPTGDPIDAWAFEVANNLALEDSSNTVDSVNWVRTRGDDPGLTDGPVMSPGSGERPTGDVILVQVTGDFVLRSGHAPAGFDSPTGSVLRVVLDAESGQVITRSLSAEELDLSKFGEIRNLY